MKFGGAVRELRAHTSFSDYLMREDPHKVCSAQCSVSDTAGSGGYAIGAGMYRRGRGHGEGVAHSSTYQHSRTRVPS